MKNNLTGTQVTLVVILRIMIGWHFLFEGFVKLLNPEWSSIGYLMDSKGFMEGLFHWMAGNKGVLNVVDFLNVWGLILVGAGLILGLFTRIAAWGGMLLLALYYLSHPPFITVEYALPSDGSYWLVNKTLIELFMLALLSALHAGNYLGFDKLLFRKN